MVVDTTERARESTLAALKLISAAAAAVVDGSALPEPLQPLADALRAATKSELAVVRTLDVDGMLVERAVSPAGGALAAELESTRVDPRDAVDEVADQRLLTPPGRSVLELAGANAVLHVPALVGGRPVGVLELYRIGEAFRDEELELARIGAAQLALAVQLIAIPQTHAGNLLEVAGEALGAAADEGDTARQVARLAAEGAGARGALLWVGEEEPVAVASVGLLEPDDEARALAQDALADQRPVAIAAGRTGTVATLRLGEPAVGVLQLLLRDGSEPPQELLDRLHGFAVRAAHALRAGARTRELGLELGRVRALLEVVGE